jgi:DNA-directed RNA polymerase subunit alpha
LLERPQFHIETIEAGLNYGRYKADPMEPGYGTTLGNALRRILLRSLEGVAVSRVRLDNVWHEFSTIPDVREDATEIVLISADSTCHAELNGETRSPLRAG